jgi:hypothetical protein
LTITETSTDERGEAPPADLLYGWRAIAKHLGVTMPIAMHLKRRHQLPTFTIGGTVCSTRSDVAQWTSTRKEQGR